MKNATASDIAKVAATLGVSKDVARLSLIGKPETTMEPNTPLWKLKEIMGENTIGASRPPLIVQGALREVGKALKRTNMGTRYNGKIVFAFFKEHGVPPPHREFAFAAPERKFRFDFAWPVLKVALEVEGGVWSRGAHGRGSGIVRDIEKYNLAVSMGWRVLRCTPDGLCLTETAELVKRTMATKD
jgi:hypothetical protein